MTKMSKATKKKISLALLGNKNGLGNKGNVGGTSWNKGMKCPWISKYQKGKKMSEETKLKLHNIFKGRKPWNTGKKRGPTPKAVKLKLSRALKGKTYEQIYGKTKAIEQRKKRALASTIHGKAYEPYDEGFNNLFKRRIRKRDNYICLMCGIHQEKLPRALDVHHIDYDKKKSIPQNCISLCHTCHGLTRLNREHWKTFFQSILATNHSYKYQDGDIVIEL